MIDLRYFEERAESPSSILRCIRYYRSKEDQEANKVAEICWLFWCPGCEEPHQFRTYHFAGECIWARYGTVECPSFYPSLRVTKGGGKECHLFVKSGQIQYLPDSCHELAGKTIPMEPHQC